MKISILGAGNIAHQLVRVFHAKSVSIEQIYNRSRSRAANLASGYDIPFTDKIGELSGNSDVYIMCVSDDGIEPLAGQLKHQLHDKLIVHTSGAVDTHVLSGYFANYGGFYPLQTFTKDTKAKFETIPVMVTSNSEENIAILKSLAAKITNDVVVVNDQERLTYHLAAVIANNFTNHLFGKASDLLRANGLEFRMILPLIEETVRKIHNSEPSQIQTGPAKRGDLKTIRLHLDMLTGSPDLRTIYIDISNSINPELKLK